MQYMLMLYADEQAGAAVPHDRMVKWMEKMHAYQQALEKAGVYVSHGGLAPSRKASTVNLEDGELKVHDGPYAETRERIGGFFIIDVPDVKDAQHWAGECPGAIWGHIEVRPFSSWPKD